MRLESQGGTGGKATVPLGVSLLWCPPSRTGDPFERLNCFSVSQTYEDQHSSEEEEEEEEESEDGGEEDDITSAESESSEEEEGGEQEEDPQHANRQQQLEWDDSTLPY